MKRMLKYLSVGLLVLLVLCVGAASWLLNSNSGLRWALQQSNGMVVADSVKGDLSDFSFNGLEIKLGETQANIGVGAAKLNLFKLLSGTLSIEALQTSDIDLFLPLSEDKSNVYVPWAGVELPIDIELKAAKLSRLSIYQKGAEVFSLDDLVTSAAVNDSELYLKKLEVIQADNRVALKGRVDLRARPDGVVRLSHQTQWRLSERQFAASGELDGTWRSLKVDQRLSQPLAAKLEGQIDSVLSDKIAWQLVLTTAPVENMQLAEETLQLGQGEVRFDGDFQPQEGIAGLRANIVAQVSGGNRRFSQWQLDSQMRLADDTLAVQNLQLDQTSQSDSGQLQVSGSVTQLSAFIQQTASRGLIDLSGDWRNLSWPLSGDTTQVQFDGSFSVKGNSDAYTLLAKAEGESYAKPLSADIDVLIQDQALDIRRLQLVSGNSILAAQGQIAERYNLSWDLRATNIGDFLSSASGSLVSVGKVTGTKNRPKLSAQASSKSLSYLNYSVAGFDLKANIVGADASQNQNQNVNNNKLGSELDPRLDVNFTSGALRVNQSLLVESVDLAISGLISDHKISFDAGLANTATLSARVDGGLTHAASSNGELTEWRGVLNQFQLDDPKLATWKLREKVAIVSAQGRLNVSQACLENNSQSLCLQVDVSPDSSELDATLVALDLANLNRFTSLYDITLSGQLDGQLAYALAAGSGSGELQSRLESRSTVLSWQDSSDGELAEDSLVIESITLDINQSDDFNATAQIDLQGSDNASLQLSVDSVIESAEFRQASANAKIALDIQDLSVLPAALLQSVNLNGSLDVDGRLNGSLARPEIVASAALKNAYAEIPELGLQLEGLEFDITSAGISTVDIAGSLRSGQGELSVNGNVDFIDITAPVININLIGEQVQLANTAELDIIGNLDLNAKLTQRLAELTGSVSLSKAVIDYKLPESAVLASGDVILEGEQINQSRIQQKLKVRVDLGEETRIKAQGLDANLLGNITIFQDPGGILRADGEIRVNEGRYQAYGQDLKIDQGSLIFGGGSVDDPSLSLSAEKTVDTITAGVSISGRASAPRLQLYSTPSMPDEDILSVLVFGKPVGNLASQDGLTLLRIANSLRGGGSSSITKITEGLQRSLGLTSLELQLEGDSPSIVAGKQLSSKFYVGYGYGLLDAVQSLILRYKLNQAWSIKADVGADSGADLRYQIER